MTCHVMEKSMNHLVSISGAFFIICLPIIEGWEVAMFEKLIWISAYMIEGVHHEGITVGEVEAQYRAEVDVLIRELCSAVSLVSV